MNQLIEWFARNRVAANMLMVTVILLGIILYPKTQKEIFPPLERDRILISSTLSGASPTQMEQTVCSPIERTVAPVDGISHIRSVSSRNSCFIAVELDYSANTTEALQQLSTRVRSVPIPSNATAPIVTRGFQEIMISRISILGDADYPDLKKMANKVASDLTQRGLNRVSLRDALEPRIAIQVSERKLLQYQLSFAEVAAALQESATFLGAGHIRLDEGTASLTVSGDYSGVEALGNTVIRTMPDGGQIRLKDVATFQDGFSAGNMISRVNGKQALSVSVYQEEHRSIIEIAEVVNQYLADIETKLPEGVEVVLVQDNSAFFSNRMQILGTNALQGLLLVFLSLMVFLNFRAAFWVSEGIVFAFCGALIVIFATGNSINMVSTFAMILVLGILVDDGIVIAENIHTHQLRGKPGVEGAIAGTVEVARPVVFSVLTNIVTFIPLFFLPSSMGVLMGQIPLIVIAALLFSLFESLLVLPAHLSTNRPLLRHEQPRWMLTDRMERFIGFAYRPAIAWVLKWRYAAITCFVASLFISISLIASGWVKVDYFAAIEAEVATGHIGFPEGTEPEKTREAIQRIEQAALDLKEELYTEYGADQILHVRTLVAHDSMTGDVFINLAGSQNRDIDATEIMARWSEKSGSFPEATSATFSSRFEVAEPGFSIRLFSANHEQLKEATAALRKHLEGYPGVHNISDSGNTANREIAIRMKESARDLGLDLKTLSAQIGQSFTGIPLPSMDRNSETTHVSLSIEEGDRNSLWHLENLPIRTPKGDLVPLHALAHLEYKGSPASIHHLDGKQVVFITAQLDEKKIRAGQLNRQVNEQFLGKLQELYPDVTSRPSEMVESEEEIKERVSLGFWISMIFMFMMMAILLGSYTQPLMILTAVPFGIVGALFGHLLFGQSLTLFSICGIVAVSGVVVNDNIVLVFYINEEVAKGRKLEDAIQEAGALRFMAIFLTTITTFLGVSTLLFESSYEAQFLIPMALSIGFGVLFATFISLFLVPALYLVTDEAKQGLRSRLARVGIRIAPAERSPDHH